MQSVAVMTRERTRAQKRFARNLKRLRLEAGLSQPAFGRAVKTKGRWPRVMERTAISRYESGKHYPSLELRIAFARTLDVELSDLDNGETEQ